MEVKTSERGRGVRSITKIDSACAFVAKERGIVQVSSDMSVSRAHLSRSAN